MILHSPAQVMAAYLLGVGIFTNPSQNAEWPMYVNSMPKVPIELASVYNSVGRMDGRIQPTGKTVEHPGFSVMLRTQVDNRASQKANQIFESLDAALNTDITVESTQYRIFAAHRTSPMLPMKEEEGGARLLFSINGILTYGAL